MGILLYLWQDSSAAKHAHYESVNDSLIIQLHMVITVNRNNMSTIEQLTLLQSFDYTQVAI